MDSDRKAAEAAEKFLQFMDWYVTDEFRAEHPALVYNWEHLNYGVRGAIQLEFPFVSELRSNK